MKMFETPTIDVEKLNIADVIATSIVNCDTDCPGQQACDAFDCPFD